jgi:hypothetical protein
LGCCFGHTWFNVYYPRVRDASDWKTNLDRYRGKCVEEEDLEAGKSDQGEETDVEKDEAERFMNQA